MWRTVSLPEKEEAEMHALLLIILISLVMIVTAASALAGAASDRPAVVSPDKKLPPPSQLIKQYDLAGYIAARLYLACALPACGNGLGKTHQ
jgi:hypothetical protein